MIVGTSVNAALGCLAGLLLVWSAGCSRSSSDSSPGESPRRPVAAGAPWYRVALTPPGMVEIPFYLQLDEAAGQVAIVVGDKRTEVPLSRSGDDVVVEFPIYHTRIRARRADDGSRMEGAFESEGRSWGRASIPLIATAVTRPDPAGLFPREPAGPPIDLGAPTTYWKIRASDSGDAKLVIEQKEPGVLRAMMHWNNGNSGYMAGTARGGEIRLAGFDTTTPYLVIAHLDPERRRLTGDWTASAALDWREHLEGELAPGDFDLAIKTHVAGNDARLDLPLLARYRGKPLLVDLAGTWCPGCADSDPFLVELYKEMHPRGLEIVTLLYEFTDDPAYNRQQAKMLKQRDKIPWEVIPIDGTVDDYNNIIPPALVAAEPGGFPIAVFVRPDDTILDVHVGFPGPEEGPDVIRRYADYYRARVNELLAAPRPNN